MTTIPMTAAIKTTAAKPNSDVPSVVAKLRATFASGKTRDLEWRRGQLAAIARMCKEAEPRMAAALASDLGRPAFDAWLADIGPSAAEAEFASKKLKGWTRRRKVSLPLSMMPGRAFYQYEPLGTVLIISPWNYPIYLTLGPLIGAIAAGNCSIIKPSEHAPATSKLLVELIDEYMDTSAVAVVEGDAAATTALLDQALDLAFFTGGPEIGKLVMTAAAKHLTPVVLELGGKSPAIVTRDADLGVTARRLTMAKFLNSGQTCVAPDYVLVDNAVKSQFLTELNTAMTDMRKDLPDKLPIVNARQFDRLTGLLTDHGGDVTIGGEVDVDSNSIERTIVVDPKLDSRLMQEEIFGPILPVVGVESYETAVAHVTAGDKPLAAYLFSNNKNEQQRFYDDISAGGMVVNQAAWHVITPTLPFGGVGTSGMGAYHGEFGFQAFSHRKAILAKPAKPDLRMIYPPYTPRVEKLLRKIM